MPLDIHYNSPYRPALAIQRPSSPPLRAQPLQEPPPRASPPLLKLASTIHPAHEADAPQVALFVQPASPALSSSASFATASELASPPEPSTSFLPPSPQGLGGSLAARRQLNKKRLSLVVPNAGPAASSLSPTTPSFLLPGGTSSDADAETRSLPPSPVSLQAFIGAEGSEESDRTIGRLMMKQQADEMREQMKGGRGMKRRTSIPRLNLAAPPPGKLGGGGGKPAPLKLGSTNGGSAVQLLRRDGVERNGVEGNSPGGAAEGDEVAEEFPYALGPREILPGIFLGSEQNARDPAVLREWGIGFVLNVAKEVDCPWVDDVIVEEEEPVSATAAEPSTTSDTFTTSLGSAASSHTPDRARPKHRRTKTQAVVAVPEVAEAPPHFVRPTSSTPNLQSIFNASAAPSPPPPAVPPLPNDLDALDRIAMTRSLSYSPPQTRRSPPRTRTALHFENGAPAAPTSTVGGAIRFPANPRTGRPPLEYLWLKVSSPHRRRLEEHVADSLVGLAVGSRRV